MNDQQLIEIINKTLEEKLDKNLNYIRYSFYELRIKYNLSEEEIDRFLQFLTSSYNIRDVVLYPLLKRRDNVEDNDDEIEE